MVGVGQLPPRPNFHLLPAYAGLNCNASKYAYQVQPQQIIPLRSGTLHSQAGIREQHKGREERDHENVGKNERNRKDRNRFHYS